MVSYRGYSDNPGWASEEGIKKDGEAIMNYAISFRDQERKLGRNKDIVIHGRSLGGAVGIYLSTRTYFKEEVKGLILENTFTSMEKLLVHKLWFLPFFGVVGCSQWKSD